MGFDIKFSRTFSIIIIVIMVCVFLLPNIIGMLHFRQYETQEDREYEKYRKQLDDRIAAVRLSIAGLGLTDSRLMACVEENAMKYARVHPMNSGGIDSIQELEALLCPYKQIEDITGIEKMSGLKYITLHDNKISRIDNIGNLPGLIELNLENNALAGVDFSFLAGLKNLETLLLAGNDGVDMQFLLKMPALKRVSLPRLNAVYCSDLENLVFASCLKVTNFQDYTGCKGQYTSRYTELSAKKRAGMTLSVEEEIEVTEYELNERKKLPAKTCGA